MPADVLLGTIGDWGTDYCRRSDDDQTVWGSPENSTTS